MVKAACGPDEFVKLFEQYGGTETARRLGIGERNVYDRRRKLEMRLRRPIYAPSDKRVRVTPTDFPQRIQTTMQDGIVIVGSDAHYWPGSGSTAHRAMVQAIKEYKPVAVVQNGDVFDGASISRHPPIGWESNPSVEDEINACRERLGEIEAAAGSETELFWTLGNHDARYETRLATAAPEYAKVHGVHLKDHFPKWRNSFSLFINDDVVIKHRLKGGIHATHNNTVQSGRTIVTGHLHSLKVTPYSDYNGTRWGVDTGTLADPYGPQFNDYTEDAPVNWRSGFVILTFEGGELMWPEVVHVRSPGIVEFRGKRYAV
jgi:hypothetical protein